MTTNGSTPARTPSDSALLPESHVTGKTSQTASRDAPLPGARMALVLLLLINLFNYIDRQVLAANLTPIEAQLLPEGGKDNAERLGNLALAFMVTYMLIAPLFGWLADRMPRWRLVGIGVILWSLASGTSGLAGTAGHFAHLGGIYALVGTFTFLLCTRCFVGIGEAAYGPVAPTVISDLYPVKVRGQVLAWFYAAIPVGGALGYAFGGLLGWPWAFYWVVPPGLLLGVWCFCMPEPPKGMADLHHGVAVRRPTLKDYLVLLRTPSYVLDCLGMSAMTFAVGGIAHFMPHYIHGTKGVENLAQVNVIFGAIVVVSGLSATLLGGIVGDRLRERIPGSYFLVSGLAMLLAFPCFLGIIYLDFPLAWIFVALSCFFLFFNTGPSNTILANVTHPAVRAQGFAVNILIIHLLGDAISPTIIGRIAAVFAVDDKPNLTAGFLGVSVLILVGGVFWLAGTPFLARDTELAPHRLSH
ncbi:MAG TPA: MFS transporter [Gemmataceae bacterium]